MRENPVIAVDAMGRGLGPSVVVPGAINAARLHDLHVCCWWAILPRWETELNKLKLDNVRYATLFMPRK